MRTSLLSTDLGLTLTRNKGVGAPAGYAFLTLNGEYLTLNGERLMIRIVP